MESRVEALEGTKGQRKEVICLAWRGVCKSMGMIHECTYEPYMKASIQRSRTQYLFWPPNSSVGSKSLIVGLDAMLKDTDYVGWSVSRGDVESYSLLFYHTRYVRT